MKTQAILRMGTLLFALSGTLSAQEIDVRLSVKYILDAGGNRPSGYYSDEAKVYDIIDQTNEMLDRWDRGYRYVVSEVVDMGAGPQFFDIADNAEFELLETTAEANPTAYAWRTWATNIYIVNSSGIAGGAAAIPSNPADLGEELVMMTVGPNPFDTIWAHELGHHNDLYHTFDASDFVADTRPDPSPLQCTQLFGCSLGGSLECCCATKIANLDAAAASQGWTQQEYDDLRWNLMSYYGATDCTPPFTFDNILLSQGQLDRWTDATRRYHSGEVSGLTYFVDGPGAAFPYDGYSTSPTPTVTAGVSAATTSAGNIVLIRSGTYLETMTIGQPVTLRANRGPVVIG